MALEPFADTVGQESATSRLEAAAVNPAHAYLLRGPKGSGKRSAALGFAGLVLSSGLEGDDADRAMKLSLAGSHPDLKIFEPQGSTYRTSEASEIATAAMTSPVEGSRKVIVVTSIELLVMATIGKLLKVIEEPPPSVVFVLLAEEVRPELVTIASRCVTIDFSSVSLGAIEQALVASGVPADTAAAAAAASGGDLGRARLLSNDSALANRAELWAGIPERLNGSGAVVVELVSQVREAISVASEPLEERQKTELVELDERAERLGERGSGRSELTAKHKREIRRHRNDEIVFGLATMARYYRDQLIETGSESSDQAIVHLNNAAEALTRNPNEALLLQSLLLRIGPSR